MNLETPIDIIPTPVRLCCGKRHWGVVCPDGRVMCCICFHRFNQDELYVDEAGDRWDMCRWCGKQDELTRAPYGDFDMGWEIDRFLPVRASLPGSDPGGFPGVIEL